MKVIQKNLIEILKKKNFSLATENLLAQCKTEKVSLMAWRLASSLIPSPVSIKRVVKGSLFEQSQYFAIKQTKKILTSFS